MLTAKPVPEIATYWQALPLETTKLDEMESGFGERVISSAFECRVVLPAADCGMSC
jgi:hypothetical protein